MGRRRRSAPRRRQEPEPRQAACNDYTCPTDCDDAKCYADTIAPLIEMPSVTSTELAAQCPRYIECVQTSCPPGAKLSYDAATTFVVDCKTDIPADRLREYPKAVGDEKQATDAAGDDGVLVGPSVVEPDPAASDAAPAATLAETTTTTTTRTTATPATTTKTPGLVYLSPTEASTSVTSTARPTGTGVISANGVSASAAAPPTSSGLSTGAIIGITLAGSVFLAAVLAALIIFIKRKPHDDKSLLGGSSRGSNSPPASELSARSPPGSPMLPRTPSPPHPPPSPDLPHHPHPPQPPPRASRSQRPRPPPQPSRPPPPPTLDERFPWLPPETIAALKQGEPPDWRDLGASRRYRESRDPYHDPQDPYRDSRDPYRGRHQPERTRTAPEMRTTRNYQPYGGIYDSYAAPPASSSSSRNGVPRVGSGSSTSYGQSGRYQDDRYQAMRYSTY